jgi:uncharacterized membrane protein YdbT with pleckstrin-like domain
MDSTAPISTRQHLIVLLPVLLQWCVLVVLLPMVSGLSVLHQHIGTTQWSLAHLFLMFLLLFLSIQTLRTCLAYWTTVFTLLPMKLTRTEGWIARNTTEILLSKIESVHVHQSLFGRMFGYGTLAIQGTGGLSDPFCYVPAPFEFRDNLYRCIHANTPA